MHILLKDQTYTAFNMTANENGLFAHERVESRHINASSIFLGMQTGPIEILPDSHPVSVEIDRFAGLAASALTNLERRRAEKAIRDLAERH